MTNGNEKSGQRLALTLLLFTVLNCAFQIAWFWQFRAHNITMDGVNYIGLARHLLDGDVMASLHGYWSPLLSWIIAAGSFAIRDFTLLGRLITIASFLVCLPLLYWLAFRLWHSRLAAAAATLWFSLARGVIAGAVTTIQADFLLTACTLLYAIFLIACLRTDARRNWVLLGIAHSLAFLAKAFAMPWLALATVLAVGLNPGKSLRGRIASLTLALFVPAIVWLTWGEVLKTKYGVFTTGYQLRANLMVDLRRKLGHRLRGDPNPLVDVSYDKYMVTEPSWASLQAFKMTNPALLPVIVGNETRNVPAALKETIILLTPGGVLGLIVGISLLYRCRASHQPEAAFAVIALVSFVSLVAAYGMLVFDARYVLPITPILIALASRFVVAPKCDSAPGLTPTPALRRISLALLVLSMGVFAVYRASPFRVVDRDFQRSCYDAVAALNRIQPGGDRLVSIGNGPYPDYGVGFEAGVYVAYLSGRHVIAMNSALPDAGHAGELAAAVLSKKADAVLVWGQPADPAYREIVTDLENAPAATSNHVVTDPAIGEVGTVIAFLAR